MATRPVVRLFVACWNGTPDTPVAQYRLADIKTAVLPVAGSQYPLLHPEFCFFATLTDGRGRHEFTIRQRFGVGPAGRFLWESRSVIVDLGSDPLATRGLVMRMKGLEFATPGQYEFVLVCDGFELEPPVYIEARA